MGAPNASRRRITDYFPKQPSTEVICIEDSVESAIVKVKPSEVAHPFFQDCAEKWASQGEGVKVKRKVSLSNWTLHCTPSHIPPLNVSPPPTEPIISFPVRDNKFQALSSSSMFDFTSPYFLQTIERSPSQRQCFDIKELNNIQERISEEVKSFHDRIFNCNDYEEDLFGVKAPKSCNRLIYFISGPSGCGKSYLIRELAEKLKVPLRYSDNLESGRSGKVFDEILTTTREERCALKTWTCTSSNASSVVNLLVENIEMFLVVEDLEVVFPSDRLHSTLSQFIKKFPPYIVLFITSTFPISFFKNCIDLPENIHNIKLEGQPLVYNSFDKPTVLHLSDLDSFRSWEKAHWLGEGVDIPTNCISWEVGPNVDQLPLISTFEDHDEWEVEKCANSLFLKDLHLSGFFWSHRSFSSWNLHFLPAWKFIEKAMIREEERRIKRTKRLLKPRRYLHHVSSHFFDFLLKVNS